MAVPTELQTILKQNGGIVTTAQANEAGVSNERLRLLVKSGDLERVTFGVYILSDKFADKKGRQQPKRLLTVLTLKTENYNLQHFFKGVEHTAVMTVTGKSRLCRTMPTCRRPPLFRAAI